MVAKEENPIGALAIVPFRSRSTILGTKSISKSMSYSSPRNTEASKVADETILENAAADGAAIDPITSRSTSIKSMTETLTRQCSIKNTESVVSEFTVATEAGTVRECRDANTSDGRGADGERDGAAVEGRALPLPSNIEPVANIDNRNCLTRTGDGIDGAIHYFFSSIELGFSIVCDSGGNGDAAPPGAPEGEASASDLLAPSRDGNSILTKPEAKNEEGQTKMNIEKAKSHDSMVSALTLGTATARLRGKTKHVKKSGCFFFGCSDGGDYEDEVLEENDLEESPPTVNNIVSDTFTNLTSGQPHILDSFSIEEKSMRKSKRSSKRMDFVTPRAESLLIEIESIQNSMAAVKLRRSSSVKLQRTSSTPKNANEIKKHQDQMDAIKEKLLQQQSMLQAAPEDTKKEYYRAISSAAMLNAEVETRRAELELKKIRLQTMLIQEEMDRLMVGPDDESFSTMESTYVTKETDDGIQHAFDIFATFATKKFSKKGKKTKTKGRPPLGWGGGRTETE